MKKSISFILASVLFLGACASKNKYPTNTKGQRVVRMGLNIQEVSFLSDSLKKILKDFNEKVGDSYEFQLFFDGQLGEQKQLIELIRANGLEMAWINTAVLEGHVSLFGAFNLPYVMNGDDHTTKTYISPEINKILVEASAPQKFVPIILFDNTPRSFFGKKPYLTPQDMKGQKIRVQQSPIYVKIVELLGGSPVPIPFTEQYTALQQGIIDGAESGPTIMLEQRLGEVAKHFTYTETTRPIDVAVTSIDFWNSLPEDHKKAFIEARDNVLQNYHLQRYYEIRQPKIDGAVNDLKVVYHTNADVAAFRKILEPMKEEWASKQPEHRKLLELIQSLEK